MVDKLDWTVLLKDKDQLEAEVDSVVDQEDSVVAEEDMVVVIEEDLEEITPETQVTPLLS